MRRRSAALKPSSRMWRATSCTLSERSAAENERCSSSSAGMLKLRIHDFLRLARFFEQHAKGRHIGIPLDQGRDPPEKPQCERIERPHVRAYARAVIVDANGAPVLE